MCLLEIRVPTASRIYESESRHHKQQVFPAGFLARQVEGQALPLQLVAHQLQPPVPAGGLAQHVKGQALPLHPVAHHIQLPVSAAVETYLYPAQVVQLQPVPPPLPQHQAPLQLQELVFCGLQQPCPCVDQLRPAVLQLLPPSTLPSVPSPWPPYPVPKTKTVGDIVSTETTFPLLILKYAPVQSCTAPSPSTG